MKFLCLTNRKPLLKLHNKIKNNRMNRIFGIIILLSLSTFLLGQKTSFSPYSRFGLGELAGSGNAIISSMGGISAGVRSNSFLNAGNPAALSALDSMSFIFEFELINKNQWFTSGEQTEVFNSSGLNAISMAFPVTSWWRSGLGIKPFSYYGYDLIQPVSGVIDQEKYYEGSGGLNKFYFSNSFCIKNKLSLGVSVSYLFGNQYRLHTSEFMDTTSVYLNTKKEENLFFSGLNYKFALQYHDQISDKFQYVIGASFSGNDKVNIQRDLFYTSFYSEGGSAVVDTLNDANVDDEKYTMPQSLTVGFVLKTEKWLLGFDYRKQDWSSSKVVGTNDSLSNLSGFNIGIGFTPDKKSISSYWKRVNYRFGAHYTNSFIYLSQFDDNIKDFGMSLGFGLPLRRTKTSFNVSFEFGQFGREDALLERYAILKLNMSLSDIWFIKRKFN